MGLPTFHEAMQLLSSYEASVNFICPIIHVPTVRSNLLDFYHALAENKPSTCGQAALYLAIFAASALFYPQTDSGVFASGDHETLNLTKALAKSSLDVLDHSRRTTSGSIEDVQANLILSLVIFHLDGNSARARLLSSTAIFLAKDLQLHRLDAPQDPVGVKQLSLGDLIDREVKRRVFWMLVTEDW